MDIGTIEYGDEGWLCAHLLYVVHTRVHRCSVGADSISTCMLTLLNVVAVRAGSDIYRPEANDVLDPIR